MIKLTIDGVVFSYFGDQLTWIWPWRRGGQAAYRSSLLYPNTFKTLRDYWVYMGGIHTSLRTNRLDGFSGISLAQAKAKRESAYGPVLLISDLDPESKPSSFWKKLGPDKAGKLNQEFCLLFPDSLDEANNILANMPLEFASVELYDRGEKLRDNTSVF